LLIYAEGVLGTNASSTNAAALAAVNRLRSRAGLLPLTVLTKDNILHERRVELAFEGDYWFDIQRQGLCQSETNTSRHRKGAPTALTGATINHYGITVTSASQAFPAHPFERGDRRS